MTVRLGDEGVGAIHCFIGTDYVATLTRQNQTRADHEAAYQQTREYPGNPVDAGFAEHWYSGADALEQCIATIEGLNQLQAAKETLEVLFFASGGTREDLDARFNAIVGQRLAPAIRTAVPSGTTVH